MAAWGRGGGRGRDREEEGESRRARQAREWEEREREQARLEALRTRVADAVFAAGDHPEQLSGELALLATCHEDVHVIYDTVVDLAGYEVADIAVRGFPSPHSPAAMAAWERAQDAELTAFLMRLQEQYARAVRQAEKQRQEEERQRQEEARREAARLADDMGLEAGEGSFDPTRDVRVDAEAARVTQGYGARGARGVERGGIVYLNPRLWEREAREKEARGTKAGEREAGKDGLSRGGASEPAPASAGPSRMSSEAREVLAHELAHVAQRQEAARRARAGAASGPAATLGDREAARVRPADDGHGLAEAQAGWVGRVAREGGDVARALGRPAAGEPDRHAAGPVALWGQREAASTGDDPAPSKPPPVRDGAHGAHPQGRPPTRAGVFHGLDFWFAVKNTLPPHDICGLETLTLAHYDLIPLVRLGKRRAGDTVVAYEAVDRATGRAHFALGPDFVGRFRAREAVFHAAAALTYPLMGGEPRGDVQETAKMIRAGFAGRPREVLARYVASWKAAFSEPSFYLDVLLVLGSHESAGGRKTPKPRQHAEPKPPATAPADRVEHVAAHATNQAPKPVHEPKPDGAPKPVHEPKPVGAPGASRTPEPKKPKPDGTPSAPVKLDRTTRAMLNKELGIAPGKRGLPTGSKSAAKMFRVVRQATKIAPEKLMAEVERAVARAAQASDRLTAKELRKVVKDVLNRHLDDFLGGTSPAELSREVGHERLLDVMPKLNPADRGNLAERWFKARYHDVRGDMQTFRQVRYTFTTEFGHTTKTVIFDEVSIDGMVWEIKSGAGKLKGRQIRQLKTYVELIGHKVTPKGQTAPIEIKQIHYVFLHPEGAAVNLERMWEYVTGKNLRLTVLRDGKPLTLDAEWLGELGIPEDGGWKKVLRWLHHADDVHFPEGRWFRSAQNLPRGRGERPPEGTRPPGHTPTALA